MYNKNNPKRHLLIPEKADKAKARSLEATYKRVCSVEELLEKLQTALELEHSTIPPYLCALYSIKDGHNQAAGEIIKSVVIEEMLHMVMVANLINALDGTPRVGRKEGKPFTPSYPTSLPGNVLEGLCVSLTPLTQKQVAAFCTIEHPSPDDDKKINKVTIGEFYEGILEDIEYLEGEAQKKGKTIFVGTKVQVGPEHYYGAGGGIIPVHCLESAKAVIHEIVGQGEGAMEGSIFSIGYHIDPKRYLLFGADVEEYAHYFRFKEVLYGRFYSPFDSAHRDGPNKGLPTGKPFEMDWDAVYNMHPNPKMDNYEKGSEIYKKTYEFNKTYSALLDNINDACNGKPDALKKGIPLMYDLKYKAVELMKIPDPIHPGYTAGPSFEYID